MSQYERKSVNNDLVISKQKKPRHVPIGLILAAIGGTVAVAGIVLGIAVLVTQKTSNNKLKRFLNAPFSTPVESIDVVKEKNQFLKQFDRSIPSINKKLYQPKIFVAISSYRDPELCVTLQDMFDKVRIKFNQSFCYVIGPLLNRFYDNRSFV